MRYHAQLAFESFRGAALVALAAALPLLTACSPTAPNEQSTKRYPEPVYGSVAGRVVVNRERTDVYFEAGLSDGRGTTARPDSNGTMWYRFDSIPGGYHSVTVTLIRVEGFTHFQQNPIPFNISEPGEADTVDFAAFATGGSK